MKIEIRECQTKVSPSCTGSFERIPQRGRPTVSCAPCKEVKEAAKTGRASSANAINAETLERTCGCGTVFKVKPGRGRKAEKCDECRAAGTVYRRGDDGLLEAFQADQVKREEQERKRAAGKERAMLLQMSMQRLLNRTNRQVIVH